MRWPARVLAVWHAPSPSRSPTSTFAERELAEPHGNAPPWVEVTCERERVTWGRVEWEHAAWSRAEWERVAWGR